MAGGGWRAGGWAAAPAAAAAAGSSGACVEDEELLAIVGRATATTRGERIWRESPEYPPQVYQ